MNMPRNLLRRWVGFVIVGTWILKRIVCAYVKVRLYVYLHHASLVWPKPNITFEDLIIMIMIVTYFFFFVIHTINFVGYLNMTQFKYKCCINDVCLCDRNFTSLIKLSLFILFLITCPNISVLNNFMNY
jgi:hypothetical protein